MSNIQNLTMNRVLWTGVSVMALIASLIGFFHSSIYDKVVSDTIMPGVLSQDLVSIILAVVLFIMVLLIKRDYIKLQVLVLAILGYMFYGYGIYVIERVYNPLYFLYMAILSLSLFAIIYFLISVKSNIIDRLQLSNKFRLLSVGLASLVPIIFYPLWISQLVPLIMNGNKIEFTYSIYILDLCLVMPLFMIVIVMAARKNAWGLFLLPVLFLKAFTVLLSPGLGELFKIRYHLPMDKGGMSLYLGLSLIYLVLAVIYLKKLKIEDNS